MSLTLQEIRPGDTVRLRSGETVVVDGRTTQWGDVNGMYEGEWVTTRVPHVHHPLEDVLEIVKRNERLCVFCGDGVTSENPATTFCRVCFYTGRAAEEQRKSLLEALNGLDGVKGAAVWHTGGGCFLLAVELEDGRLLTCTEGEASLPEADETWGLIGVWESEQAYDEGDEARVEYLERTRKGEWTDEAFVALVRGLARS